MLIIDLRPTRRTRGLEEVALHHRRIVARPGRRVRGANDAIRRRGHRRRAIAVHAQHGDLCIDLRLRLRVRVKAGDGDGDGVACEGGRVFKRRGSEMWFKQLGFDDEWEQTRNVFVLKVETTTWI